MDIKKNALDFANTQIAFSNKTDKELKKTAWLFEMMNKPFLVSWGSKLAMKSVKLGLPFAETISLTHKDSTKWLTNHRVEHLGKHQKEQNY